MLLFYGSLVMGDQKKSDRHHREDNGFFHTVFRPAVRRFDSHRSPGHNSCRKRPVSGLGFVHCLILLADHSPPKARESQ